MKKLIFCISLFLLFCAVSVNATEYESIVFEQRVIFDVKPFFPGMGVMVVSVDGEWLCNIGWRQDLTTMVYYGKDGVVFTIDGNILTLRSPAQWVFTQVGVK